VSITAFEAISTRAVDRLTLDLRVVNLTTTCFNVTRGSYTVHISLCRCEGTC